MSISERGIAIKQTIPLNRVQKAMAKGMRKSVDSMALSQMYRDIDVTALKLLYDELKIVGSQTISLNTLFMAVVAQTLKQYPALNGELQENNIIIYEPVNLGMAVSTEMGLIVVVIHAAEKKTLSELMESIEDVSTRARKGKLEMSDIEGGTFTVSNLGMYGIDGGFPIPRYPEGAILLLGAIKKKPVVIQEDLVFRDMCTFTLTYDHLWIDGSTAAQFLKSIDENLKEPGVLLNDLLIV